MTLPFVNLGVPTQAGGQDRESERHRRQKKFARNMDGYQILLYRGFLAVLEVGLSVTNAVNSEAWALQTFAQHVFAASAVMESLGLAFSLLLMVIHRDVRNIGQPLTVLSGLVSKQVARRLERGRFRDVWFSGGSPEHLVYVFIALSFSNGVFLIMYLFKYQRAVLYWILIVVGCLSVLLSIVWVRVEDGTFSRDILAYLDGFVDVVLPFIILLVGVVFSPIILELLESITLLTAEIDDRDVSENTIELIILDIVMVIPFVMAVVLFVRDRSKHREN